MTGAVELHHSVRHSALTIDLDNDGLTHLLRVWDNRKKDPRETDVICLSTLERRQLIAELLTEEEYEAFRRILHTFMTDTDHGAAEELYSVAAAVLSGLE